MTLFAQDGWEALDRRVRLAWSRQKQNERMTGGASRGVPLHVAWPFRDHPTMAQIMDDERVLAAAATVLYRCDRDGAVLIWRAEHDGLIYGHAPTREAAQEMVEGLPFARVTETTSCESWLRHNDGTWAETVRASSPRRLTDPNPETWPHLPARKDIDG